MPETYQLKKTVVLVGMMGSGKTAIGTALARMIGVTFLDSDAEIERAANRSIAEIFERDGETFFREKERQVLKRLLRTRRCILSTGGGAYLSDANRQIIHDGGIAVWLKADPELLWSRVRNKDTRPLLRTPDPHATLLRLHAERTPAYEKAEIVVEARSEYSIEDMAARVLERLLERADVIERSPA